MTGEARQAGCAPVCTDSNPHGTRVAVSKLHVYRAILVVLTAADLLCAVVLAPATLMASLMMFDTPGSEQRW